MLGGGWTDWKIHKAVNFLSNTYLDPSKNNNATQPAFSIGPLSTVIPDGQMSASFVYYVGTGPLEKILIRAWPEYAYFFS